MGKYIDRIIEVLDDNNVWKAVVLPRNEMGEKEESIVNSGKICEGDFRGKAGRCDQKICFSTEASRPSL